MERTYGREVIDEIHRLSKMSVPFYPYQMKELIDELRDKISKLPATQLQGS